MTMTQTQLDAWINALLSGEYKQGRSLLHAVDRNGSHTFCCLGVLCEVSLGKTITIEKMQLPFRGSSTDRRLNHVESTFSYNGDRASLPDNLFMYYNSDYMINVWDLSCLPWWRKLHLKVSKNQHFDTKHMQVRSLEVANDLLKLSFKEIAAVLRHNVIVKKELEV